MNQKRIDKGEANYLAVLAYMSSHLCATQRECAEALGLSVMAVNRHVKRIRGEWRNDQTPD